MAETVITAITVYGVVLKGGVEGLPDDIGEIGYKDTDLLLAVATPFVTFKDTEKHSEISNVAFREIAQARHSSDTQVRDETVFSEPSAHGKRGIIGNFVVDITIRDVLLSERIRVTVPIRRFEKAATSITNAASFISIKY